MRLPLSLMASTLVAAIAVAASDLIRQDVLTGELTLGSPIEVAVTVNAPPESVAFDPPGAADRVRVLRVSEPDTVPGNAQATRLIYVAQALGTGKVQLPVIRARIAQPDGSELIAESGPASIQIPDPLRGARNPSLHPARPQRTGGSSRFSSYWLAGLISGLVAAAVYIMTRKRGDEAKAPEAPTPGPAPTPTGAPWDRAIEELARLEPPAQEGAEEARDRVDQIGAVVRRYIEERFGLAAPERTTEEFLTEAKGSTDLVTHQALLSTLLDQCDRVKFAGQHPERGDVVTAITHARDFVVQTRPGVGRTA